MNVLEKILEEIEEIRDIMKSPINMDCFEEGCKYSDCTVCVCENIMDIIRSHMDEVEDGWIPVEERLPEGGDIIYPMQIVTLDNGDVCLGVYRHDDKEWLTRMSEGELYYTNSHIVVAWMPLPEPYKPKETTATCMEHIMSRFTKVE